jgi:DNA mismatch endonuclease, patch repair protein
LASHEGCRKATVPKSNIGFWSAKLENNRRRDERVELALKTLGWTVATIWECETKTQGTVEAKLKEILRTKDDLGQSRARTASLSSF